MPPPALREAEPSAAARFESFTTGGWRRLPAGVRRVVPPTFLGFALINGFTFAVDLALLAVLHERFAVPHAAAITIGYATAFTLAFVLNRWLNFRSHGPLGDQVGRYVVVVALNYTLLVLGIGAGLAALGVPLLAARLVAGSAEAVWMYAAMRWWVFGGRDQAASARR